MSNFWKKAKTKENEIQKEAMSDQILELERYLPENIAERILTIIRSKNLLLKITKHRKTKFGDYRSPQGKLSYHTITVNSTLNQYAFLITFLHEFAHLQIHEVYNRKVAPHGQEWKTAFAILLNDEIKQNSFPRDLIPSIKNYIINPKASTFSDSKLYEALRNFDENKGDKPPFLKSLSKNDLFQLGKKQYRRGELQRTRYVCKEIKTGKLYLVHQNAEVYPIEIT